MKYVAPRTAQYPLYKEAIVNFDDFNQANTLGAVAGPNFGAGAVALALALPPGCKVLDGILIVETPFTGGGATAFVINVGDINLATRYLAAQSVFAAPANAVPLVVPNFQNANGDDMIIAGVLTGGTGLTAGRLRIGVRYVMDKRSQEVEIL